MGTLYYRYASYQKLDYFGSPPPRSWVKDFSMATSTSNWPIRKTQNQIILVPTPHTCVLRVLIENNSNLNVWKLSIADIPYKNNYILVPPPPTQLGVEGSVYLKVRGTVGRYQSLYGR